MRITVVSPAPSDIDRNGGMIVIDAEALGVFGDQRHADVAGEPHRHQVVRMLDAIAQRVRAARLAFEVLRPPDSEPGPWSISIGSSRSIEDGV